jgi:hypothetical protein
MPLQLGFAASEPETILQLEFAKSVISTGLAGIGADPDA